MRGVEAGGRRHLVHDAAVGVGCPGGAVHAEEQAEEADVAALPVPPNTPAPHRVGPAQVHLHTAQARHVHTTGHGDMHAQCIHDRMGATGTTVPDM